MNYRNKYKKARNKMNKCVKQMNAALAKDNVFPNRFYIREVGYFCYPYEDGSGATMNVQYRIFDKATDNTGDFVLDNYGFPWHFWNYVNDFIIRCRDGQAGHIPPLQWIALDIKSVKE